jgi:hypothetical protein
VTMPVSGNGSTQYTVTGIPITGTLTVSCRYSGPPTEANLPTCTYGPVHAPEPVNAGQTVTGTILFYRACACRGTLAGTRFPSQVARMAGVDRPCDG